MVVLAVILLVPAAYILWSDKPSPPPLYTEDLAPLDAISKISYAHQIAPILERRCVVCHGCYDAPCQLKLSARQGLERGASKERVYNGKRLANMAPTRLFIDARDTAGWRRKGFHPVIGESPDPANPAENLRESLLYQLLRLKRDHPQPIKGRLPDNFDLALNRDQYCPTLEEFGDFSTQHPLWGMPYALPDLEDEEYRLLVTWIAQGTPFDTVAQPSPQASAQIATWENLLNGTSNKERLISRYLYEHLFHAHIHFAQTPDREFYQLVRSSTPPGQAIEVIATVRPFDDPGDSPFYYRLMHYPAAIVAKNHIVYEFSPRKLERIKSLFFDGDFKVGTLPTYEPSLAANPFKVFAPIPPSARYRFLLDDAQFFIEGFVKGPVCRGQVALDSIEDQFWVLFFNPDHNIFSANPSFLSKMGDHLALPSVRNTDLHLSAIWNEGWKEQRKYMLAKEARFMKIPQQPLDQAMNYIWDGGGDNRNAALTVFRHLDSASVSQGLIGDYPETAWVIDYPLFERIHYLLVAGYNVFGNVSHQLHTRVFMDFLRMEGEDYFLAFLPASHRARIRDSWYQGIRAGIAELLDAPKAWLRVNVVTGYRSDDPQRELYQHIQRRLAAVADEEDRYNRCHEASCTDQHGQDRAAIADAALIRIAHVKGAILDMLPDVSFLRVRTGGPPENDLAYTLIHNKAYKNILSLLEQDSLRDHGQDTLTVIKGLEGSYPNFFFVVKLDDLTEFSRRLASMKSEKDYRRFVDHYGIRRTSNRFWETADWFHDYNRQAQPLRSGIYDLNRYHNH